MFWRRRREGPAPVQPQQVEEPLDPAIPPPSVDEGVEHGPATGDRVEEPGVEPGDDLIGDEWQEGSTEPAGLAVGGPAGPAIGEALGPDPETLSPEEEQAALAEGVRRSRQGFVARIREAVRGGGDDEVWEGIEEALIAGDVGATVAMDVVSRAQRRRDLNPETAVRAELAALFAPRSETPWPRIPAPGVPAIVLVVGVNGTGKTTTIAKLAHRFSSLGANVLLAAGDTFRAAAVEQLQTWARRVGVPVIAHKAGADPAAVVYDAMDAAVSRGVDVVIVDTAGRLHTKSNLMEELAKIRRTISKRLPGAEPEVLFVLDATTGQNGLAQAKAFHESAGLTGVALTKLDSTAKGGIAFAIERTLGVPVLFVGVGEKMTDLLDFDPDRFVEELFR